MTSLKDLSIEFKKITNDLFSLNGFECRKLYYGKRVYYCARDILLCLGYDEDLKILKKLRDCDKFYIKDLEEMYKTTLICQDSYDFDINKELIDSQDKYEKKNIYINDSALYFLIETSTKEESKPFQDFVYYTLFPTIYKVYELYINQKNKKKNFY